MKMTNDTPDLCVAFWGGRAILLGEGTSMTFYVSLA